MVGIAIDTAEWEGIERPSVTIESEEGERSVDGDEDDELVRVTLSMLGEFVTVVGIVVVVGVKWAELRRLARMRSAVDMGEEDNSIIDQP